MKSSYVKERFYERLTKIAERASYSFKVTKNGWIDEKGLESILISCNTLEHSCTLWGLQNFKKLIIDISVENTLKDSFDGGNLEDLQSIMSILTFMEKAKLEESVND